MYDAAELRRTQPMGQRRGGAMGRQRDKRGATEGEKTEPQKTAPN